MDNNYKKKVVFGTGSFFLKMNKKYKLIDEIDFFIESKPIKKEFFKKKVISLAEFEKILDTENDYQLIICSSFWEDVKKSLKTHLLKKCEVIDLYKLYLKQSMELTRNHNKMLNFIESYKIGEDVKRIEEKILILIKEWSGAVIPYHLIVLGMLLKSEGANVEFLIADTSNSGDLDLYSGAVEYQNKKILEVLSRVKELTGIEYFLLSNFPKLELTEEENGKLKKKLYYQLVWYTKKILFDKNKEVLKSIENNWFENAKLIKGFLKNREYSKVVTFTGMHFEWAIMYTLAKQFNLKVYTYEYIRDGFVFSIEGPSVLQLDLKLFDNKLIDEKVMKFLLNYTNEYIDKKNLSEVVPTDDIVLIPLNIFWDSAAFGENDLFETFEDWLIKTIDYIVSLRKVKVIVRQHPNEAKFNTGSEVQSLLLNRYKDNEYFEFISADSNINTYDLMKNARIILPNTSTVGIEGAIMGKCVIVKNNVYYANSGFVEKATSIDHYFDLINKYINMDYVSNQEKIDKAKLYFAMSYLNVMDCSFGHQEIHFGKVLTSKFNEVKKWNTVKWLLEGIINDKPLLENIISEKLLEL